MSRHGSLCRDMVLCVATWFLGYKRLLVRDRGFTSSDRVVFFWFSVTTGVLPMSRPCFVLFLDNVTTKGPLSQSRWPRQEVRVATGDWLRLRNFRSRQKILVSRQDFTELCHDGVFYVVTRCAQDQRALCRDTTFCVLTKLAKPRVFYRDRMFLCRNRAGQARSFMSR